MKSIASAERAEWRKTENYFNNTTHYTKIAFTRARN